LRLAFARAGATVAGAIRGRGQLWHRFWRPLCWAVLNTTPERGAAALLWRAMSETFLRGGRHCRPVFAPQGLGTALIDPAVARLQQHGATLSFQHALRGVTTEGDRLSALHFTNGSVKELGKEDRVVLALPPSRLKAVLPWVDVPADDAGIVNVHFRIADPTIIADRPPMTGLVNATTHWIFIRGDVISLTISAADRLGPMTRDPEELLPELWLETCQALDLGDANYVAARVNKERRATFDQSPAEVARRPSARTALTNLFLAGDATDTGLPATIEGAVRSGNLAARLAA
ncbi:MAG: FAD-dependent oxidoreductase, partial [Pseudomonadota bacterium]